MEHFQLLVISIVWKTLYLKWQLQDNFCFTSYGKSEQTFKKLSLGIFKLCQLRFCHMHNCSLVHSCDMEGQGSHKTAHLLTLFTLVLDLFSYFCDRLFHSSDFETEWKTSKWWCRTSYRPPSTPSRPSNRPSKCSTSSCTWLKERCNICIRSVNSSISITEL